MRPWELERLRLEAEAAECFRLFAQAAEAFRVCQEQERAEGLEAEVARLAALHDEGLPRSCVSVATLERWRLDRADAHGRVELRLEGLRAATKRAEERLRSVEAQHLAAVVALERHARVEERREGRGGSEEPAR